MRFPIKLNKIILFVMVFLISIVSVYSLSLVEQQNSNGDSGVGWTPSSSWYAQTITIPANGGLNLTEFVWEVYITNNDATDGTCWLAIYEDNAGTKGNFVNYSLSNYTCSDITGKKNFTFSNYTILRNQTKYWIVFENSSNFTGVSGTAVNNYMNSNVYNGGRIKLNGADWLDYDFTFKYYGSNISIPSSSPITAELNTIFKNDTSDYKLIFQEGEEFSAYINYTYTNNGSSIPNGECNISFTNGIIENNSLDQEFTLCNGACDYSIFTEQFYIKDNNSVYDDYIHFDICHNKIPSRDLIINFNCSTGSDVKLITSAEIPTCASGSKTFFINSSKCKASKYINISLINNAIGVNQGHNITELAYDREFTVQNNIFNEDVFYNISSGFYELNPHEIEYYKHGNKTVYTRCDIKNGITNTTKVKLNQITIANEPPRVIFDLVNTSLGLTYFSHTLNVTQIEYANSTYEFRIIIEDDDLANYSISVWNKSTFLGGIFYTNTTLNKSVPLIPKINSIHFRDDEDNPFGIVVIANDLYGDTTNDGINFYVNDTESPRCSGLNNQNVYFNESYVWDVECTDEAFYSFNISCDTGFNYYESGLNTIFYEFDNSTAIVENTTCIYEYCDGHTLKEIPDLNIGISPLKDKLYVDNRIIIENNQTEITISKSLDRYNFTVESEKAVFYHEFNIRSNSYITIMGNDKYTGWLVTEDYWIDFENDLITFSEVERISDNEVKVKLTFSKPSTRFEFNSIGKLNCVSGSQFIGVVKSPLGVFKDQVCPLDRDLSYVIGFFGIIALLITLLIIGETFMKFPFITFFVGFAFIVVTIPFYGCGEILGVAFTSFGLVLIMIELFRFFGNPFK